MKEGNQTFLNVRIRNNKAIFLSVYVNRKKKITLIEIQITR